jgi:dihydrofolate synthase/folylpolyglutamate synthase
LPQPALRGAHQIDNAATALACAHYLGIGAAAMATGLQTVRWAGRLQKLTRGPMLSALTARLPEADVYLDGGHNEAAAHILADWLLAQKPRPVHVVLAMLASKAHDPYLAALARVQAAGRNLHIHAVPIADNENALAPQDLVAAARQAGCAATAHDNPAAALATISEPDALVLIAGSLYLAGAVLQNHQ